MELVLYFIFVQISLLIPGYVIVERSNLFRSHPTVSLCLGYLTSIFLFGLLAIVYYVFNPPTIAIQIIFWSLLGASLIVFFSSKLYLKLRKQWLPIVGFIVMSGFTLCFTFLNFSGNYLIIPDPEPRADRNYDSFNVKILNIAQTNANDNYIPYRQAQFFVNRSNPATDSFIDEWGVSFFQRTPLMGAVTAQYFLAFSDSPPVDYTWSNGSSDPGRTYEKFQVIAQILNSLFLVPAFFLIRKLFNRKTAILSMLFIIPSQFFLYNAFFSWPKSMVAFFVLLSWYLLVKDRRLRFVVAAAIASGLAYLTHDLAVLYVGASFIFLLFNKRIRDSLIIAGGSALFAAPWLFISSVVYHRASSFIYYPISTENIPQPERIKEVISVFINTSPFRLVMIRLESLFYLLSPYQLLFDEGGQSIIKRLWAFGLYSIPGALGAGLVIPAVLAFFKRTTKTIGLWALIFMPLVLCVIVIGWPKGLGAIHFAQAVVVLLTGLAISVLVRAKQNWLIYGVFGVNLAQLIVLLLFSYNFSIDLFSLKNILLLFLMLVVIVGCIIGIYLTQKHYAFFKKS